MEAALIGAPGRILLGSTKVTIGRTQDNMLVVPDPKVSSHHAEVRPEGAFFSIVDLGSTNGTFVNEQRIDRNVPRLLQPGDILRVGDTKFTFEVTNVPQVMPSSGGSFSPVTPPPPPQPASTEVVPTFADNASSSKGERMNGGYLVERKGLTLSWKETDSEYQHLLWYLSGHYHSQAYKKQRRF
jgi:pSer/pThr/pTyr-binding forkhead associated (FHA) protein